MVVSVRRPDNPQSINQGARYTLFVEGTFDQQVLTAFFNAHPLDVELRVQPFGSAISVRSAAEALHPYHPEYYFLVDRDHVDDDEVARSWEDFPDPRKHNILIWRRRELENYFLIPEYLLRSPFLRVDEERLRRCIREVCRRRLFLDAANHVITGLREGFKRKWIALLPDRPDQVRSRDAAQTRLENLEELPRRRDELAAAITPSALSERLGVVLRELGGEDGELLDQRGLWRERLRGKRVLPEVVQRCFQVWPEDGRVPLQGEASQREVAKNLVRRPLADQPEDLQALHRLLNEGLARGTSPGPAPEE